MSLSEPYPEYCKSLSTFLPTTGLNASVHRRTVRRMIEDLCSSLFFNHTSSIHHLHNLPSLVINTKIMGDQHNGRIDLILQIAHQIQNPCLNSNVKSCGRLISDNQSWITCKTDCDTNTLDAYRQKAHEDTFCKHSLLAIPTISSISMVLPLTASCSYPDCEAW